MNPYPPSHKWRVLHFSWIAFFCTFFAWFAFPPLAVLAQADIGFTDAQFGWLATLGVALTVPGRVLIGRLVDRFGPRIVYSVLLALAAIPVALLGTAQSFGQLAALRLCIGLVGCGFVVGIRIIADWFPPRQLGLVQGIYGGWGNAGSALAALALPAVAVLFGWRVALSLAALPLLVWAVVYWFGVSDVPAGKVFRRRPRESSYSPWKDRTAMTLALVYLATFGSELCVIAFLPKLFYDRFGMSILLAGTCAALFPLMNLVARPGGGWLADRFGRKRALLITLACAALAYPLLGAAPTLPLAIVAVLFAGASVQAADGAVFATVPLVSPLDTGRVAGVVGAAGNVGGFLFPLAFGYGLQWSGGSFLPGFLIVSVAACIALAAISRVHLPDAESASDRKAFELGDGPPIRVRMRGKTGNLRRNLRVAITERKAV